MPSTTSVSSAAFTVPTNVEHLRESEAVEVVRVSPDDARYIVCLDDSVYLAGKREDIAKTVAFLHTMDFDGDVSEADELFDLADEFGGNSRRTAYGISRFVPHVYEGDSEVEITGITEDDFARLVDAIESVESSPDEGDDDSDDEFDDTEFDDTDEYSSDEEEAARSAARKICDEMVERLSDYSPLWFNDVEPHFLAAGMNRVGIRDGVLEDVEPDVMYPVGSVDDNFQAVLVEIGAAVARRLRSEYVERTGDPDENGDLANSEHLFILWWAAAAAFLLADVEAEGSFASREDAVSAGVAVVEQFMMFDAIDIVDMFAVGGIAQENASSIRSLMLRCATDGYPIEDAMEMLDGGASVQEVLAMMDAGVGADLASAALTG